MTVLQNYINDIHNHYDAHAVAEYPFPPAMTAKLMQEQKWSAEYTGRVLAEYRRFIHLAATAGHEVTPSQIVDEAWHMHLTFSRDYWEKLVPLLPAPLHHEPGTGEAGDSVRYAEQYRRTLADYRAAFGQEPPADIWPTPQTSRTRRRRNNWPTALGVGLAAAGVLAVMNVNLVVALVVGVVAYLLVNQYAGAWATGSGGGGSCGGASCGFVGGDSCDVGGDGGCSDGGGDGGGGDGGSCGGGCGGGCGS